MRQHRVAKVGSAHSDTPECTRFTQGVHVASGLGAEILCVKKTKKLFLGNDDRRPFRMIRIILQGRT
jgi:hypothetical protein